MAENGIEARVKVLESRATETERRLASIEGKLDRIMSIGWSILGALVVGIAVTIIERV